MTTPLAIPPALMDPLVHLGFRVTDLVLYVNSRCNLRCLHCYVGTPLLDAANELTIASIADFLAACGHLDRITVLGGEPLMHSAFPEILNLVACSDISEKRITTNLTFLTGLDVETLKSAQVRICVSLDGHTTDLHEQIRGPRTFARTVNNLKFLIASGVDVEVTHTVTQPTLRDVNALIDFCKGLGLRRLNLHKVSPRGNAAQNRDLDVSPTEWRLLVGTLEARQVAQSPDAMLLRYELLFVDTIEHEALQRDGYRPHASGSFYSQDGGHRIVLYPDGKVYISSEAFGSESYVGSFTDGSFKYNSSSSNELDLTRRHGDAFRISMLNPLLSGDANYPVALSVSYRRTIFV